MLLSFAYLAFDSLLRLWSGLESGADLETSSCSCSDRSWPRSCAGKSVGRVCGQLTGRYAGLARLLPPDRRLELLAAIAAAGRFTSMGGRHQDCVAA